MSSAIPRSYHPSESQRSVGGVLRSMVVLEDGGLDLTVDPNTSLNRGDGRTQFKADMRGRVEFLPERVATAKWAQNHQRGIVVVCQCVYRLT